jgi:tetratricopeptide (TPR) repeat protein
LADLHRYKEATEILRSCLEGFKKLNDQRGQMLVLQELGNVEIYSNPEKAIEYNKQAMRIAESLSDDLLMANSLHGIGVAYFELKQFTKAEKSFQKSLELTSKVGDVKGLIATYVELAGLMVQMKKLKKASRLIHKARELCEETNYFGALPKIELTEGGLLEAKGKMDEAKQKYLLASDLFKDAGDKVNAKYATKQATMIDNRPLAEWIFNVMNGRYKAELGSDGLTDSERRLNPFVGKKVRVVVNQGKWPGITDAGMRLVFEGTLCKEKVVERIPKWDKLMGHGKFNWWVQGKPVEGAEGDYANWMIAPIFVESITQIR